MAVITYKCPSCDGPLKFSPEEQNFTCEYCGSVLTLQELEKLNPKSQSEQVIMEDGAGDELHADTQAAVIYSCPSCGAEVVTDETTAATFCFYCHNPVVLTGRLTGELLPDSVIPFTVSRKDAVEAFEKWVGSKRYVPSDFYCASQIEKMTGVYFPYWVSQWDMQASLEAQAKNLRIWRVGNLEYTETTNFRTRRAGRVSLHELIRLALGKENKELVEGVLPFDMSAQKDFSLSYLSGFQAEKRDIEFDHLENALESEVENYTRILLRDSVRGYTAVHGESYNICVDALSARYTLMPVWVLTYRSGGKTYYYAMNGQTSKIYGVLPVDKAKLMRVCAGIFSAVSAVMLLGGYLI